MSEDIKKIIDEFDWHIENNESMCCLSMSEVYQLKDYILNLQQKVEWYEGIELNKTIDKLRVGINKQINDLQQENNQLKEEKRKVLNYINNLSNEPNTFGHYGIDSRCKNWLLKILKGEV